MSTSKHFDKVAALVTALALLLTVLFMNSASLGVTAADRSIGYEDTLFDTSRVHTIDIVIDDWDVFLETCESETYSTCSVVIDNESVKNVAIRGKGNTSLSTVKTLGSERYSFKIEFDQYQSGKTYHGLDKLSLNNIIQDNTYMKDYLAYRLMAEYGVNAPLCSFAYITVNGEDWGLYLAVEGVEDSFLKRNYGSDGGELYKPDSMSFGGGGPGNGKGFNMDDFINRDSEDSEASGSTGETRESSRPSGGFPGGNRPEGFDPSQFGGGFPGGGELPEGFDPTQLGGEGGSSERHQRGGGDFNFGSIFGGMGSSDVKLQYSDDDPDSYSNIFNNAKTTVTTADKNRLIEAIKKLNSYEDIENVVDADEVIRYFVVHNFVCNGDSYTGSIIHNYYLHESDGRLSMIPWDYNLAFGTFQSSDATDVVNDPIDTPMSVSDPDDRPMWGWIMNSEEYTAMYHEYFAEFLDTVDAVGIIDAAYELIKSYVEKDPTAFCTYEEFETGVATLRAFCELRTESVRGQLNGTIPSTGDGQDADSSAMIDASAITVSDMGSMGGGMGGGPSFSSGSDGEAPSPDAETGASPTAEEGSSETSGMPDFGGGFTPPDMSSGSFTPPDMSSGSFTPPDMGSGGFTPPEGFGEAAGSAVSTETWIMLGASAAVLLAGVVFARLYRKRG